ncbi:MlaD family protein [Nocardia rhizosphaerihabitans]|uniref:ABC transporter substrate-binding protein n=1 Tax=Nocardia rhizosphaerihabitans TaxID=1691570 RepID=A0ABQ2KE35_9NOCA|nr:MlaD family protein [Nocardia rhizosphaerihabitans]GGN80765.1 ABC transporter substrate-binding protein [Nocardia rhizosphaerihabitans]
MLTRLLGSRGFLSVAVVLIVGLVAVGAYKIAKPTPTMRSYCADMPDAIGLYEGSAVTIMGIKVGSITRVSPQGATARVEFTVPESRKLPVDVGATTMADSLVADRQLALIGAEPEGAGWDSSHCITKSVTPKSLSQTFAALADLADQLNGPDGPGEDVLERGIAALDNTTAGTGEQVNTIIHKLGSALNSPDAAIGHIGALLDALSSLASSAAHYWPEVKDYLTRLTPALVTVSDQVVPPVITTVRELIDVLPALNDLTVMFGGPLLAKLERVENLPEMLQAGVAGLSELMTMVPSLTSAFTNTVDPATGAISVAYATPNVTLPGDPAQVCAAINVLTPGGCLDPVSGTTKISMAHIILGTVGAR